MGKQVKEGKVPDLTKENIEGVIKTLLEMKDKLIIREDVDATIKAEGKEIAVVAVPGGYQITVLEVGQEVPAPPAEPAPSAAEVPAEPKKKEEEPTESARTDKGVDEGKVPDTASANQEGIIKDLLEKHGLKEDAAPVSGEQTKQDEHPVVEASVEAGKTYRITKKMDVPYFRWEFPSNLAEMSIGDVADAATEIETLEPGSPRSVQVIDVIGTDRCKDGDVVLAAQNLSDDGDRYQPSSKHLYIIPAEVFEKSTVVVKTASEENVVSEEEVRESVRIMKGLR